ncbi:MAG TPA: NADPH--cytochrome reductase, partial [Ktedonobacteraceae bacterium]|nr:NADPH--cytochrome reductase [Ktedonobacteraceae bacterium]
QKHEALYEIEIVRRPHPFPFVNSFGALPMTILQTHDLDKHSSSSTDLDHATRHIEIALPTDMAYLAGDHLGVIGSNEPDQVRRVAEHFLFDQQTIIQLHNNNGRKPIAPTDEPISVHDLLANYVELQDIARREHIRKMVEYTSDATEKQHLARLVDNSAEGEAAYKREILDRHASVIDLLEDHPSCALPFSVYLEFLTPLRPRYYSISSSPLIKRDECSITVSIVRGPARSGHGVFEGVCSSYLERQRKGDLIYAFIQNTSGPFHPPQDLSTPIIMIAAGTGLSPFRGFLQSRSVLIEHGAKLGQALLLFGCRHPEVDFLYKEELENFEKAGVVKLHTAFSRLDPQKKVFVQDKILEQKDEIWQLLQQKAVVYICGNADTMVPDVHKSFVSLIQEKIGKSEQEASAWLNNLIKEKRYLVDIWGVEAI